MASANGAGDETEIRSRKPKESKFKQQSLPAWQPILTAGTVLPTFFVIGIAFIPIGKSRFISVNCSLLSIRQYRMLNKMVFSGRR